MLWKALLEVKICRDKLVSSSSAPGRSRTPHVSVLAGHRHNLLSKHPVWEGKALACCCFWWRFAWFNLQTFEENKNVWMPREWVTTQFWISLLARQSSHCRARISWSRKRYWIIGLKEQPFCKSSAIKQMSFSAFHWRDSLFVCQALSGVFTLHFHCCKLLLSGCLERRKKQQLTFHRGQAERLGICYLETITLTILCFTLKPACISFHIQK